MHNDMPSSLNKIISTECGLGHTLGVQGEFGRLLRWVGGVPDCLGTGVPSCSSVSCPGGLGRTGIWPSLSLLMGTWGKSPTGVGRGLRVTPTAVLVLTEGCVSPSTSHLLRSSQCLVPPHVAHEQTENVGDVIFFLKKEATFAISTPISLPQNGRCLSHILGPHLIVLVSFKLLKLSKPSFPRVYTGMKIVPSHGAVVRIKWDNASWFLLDCAILGSLQSEAPAVLREHPSLAFGYEGG